MCSGPWAVGHRGRGDPSDTTDGLSSERLASRAKHYNQWRIVQVLRLNDKNSSGDEIAYVNFLRRYGTYVLQNTKNENLLRLTN